jgi:hypothetical protein
MRRMVRRTSCIERYSSSAIDRASIGSHARDEEFAREVESALNQRSRVV